MQSNYEYLEMPDKKAPVDIVVSAGMNIEFQAQYFVLYSDLRSIEDNYRLIKKLDILLKDSKACDLSDTELKIAMRSCVYSIVQTVCRILEKPPKTNLKKTNCLYSRIRRDIECENTKQRALSWYKKLVNQQWYRTLKTVRDKRISHQEKVLGDDSAQLIGEFLSQSEEALIDEIKEVLDFCASATLNGGRARYVSRLLDSHDS